MDKIREIQKKLQEKELDAVLITDEKNQRYATGFAFTDGAVVVTREHAYLITDSRYVEAAEQAVTERTKVILFGQNRRLVPCIQEILQSEKIENSCWISTTSRMSMIPMAIWPAMKRSAPLHVLTGK